MPSALIRGRGVRYYPSNPRGKKPPKCAGIYYIYDADGNLLYTGQAVDLRRRVYEHRRKGKIPTGGYVDCFKAKECISHSELDETERIKIDKYSPPLNRRKGGGGRKSPKLKRDIESTESTVENFENNDRVPETKNSIIHRLLGYEKVDCSGETKFIKAPKSLFPLIIELVIKFLSIATFLLVTVGLYLGFVYGTMINQFVLLVVIAFSALCLILFGCFLKNKVFSITSFISAIGALLLYVLNYLGTI